MIHLYLLTQIKIHITMQQLGSPPDTSHSILDTIRELSGQSEKRKNFYEEQKLQLLKKQA